MRWMSLLSGRPLGHAEHVPADACGLATFTSPCDRAGRLRVASRSSSLDAPLSKPRCECPTSW